MELGLYTFADVNPNPSRSKGAEGAERLKHLIEEIELADQVGLDVFGLGEHHRPDYAASAPAVVLAAAAVKTRNIRLTSAVTVLSSDDPVRVFQQFSTLDLISSGRAEIMTMMEILQPILRRLQGFRRPDRPIMSVAGGGSSFETRRSRRRSWTGAAWEVRRQQKPSLQSELPRSSSEPAKRSGTGRLASSGGDLPDNPYSRS